MTDDDAIRTDLYQLTMMQGYHASGRASLEATFELFFRSVPERGGYVIAAGIEPAIDAVLRARFSRAHRAALGQLGLFQDDFLEALGDLRFTGDIDAVPEGTCVFPREPLLVARAPLWQAQWMETLLLNTINFASLIATKASRMVTQARPAAVVEFGMRRAQGPDGALTVARSAYLAGCAGTSNVEAGLRYYIPLMGTHAHSWIMSFPTEREAFETYASFYPDQSVLLLDTFDTLKDGLPDAVAVGRGLQEKGHVLGGVRLDSGDLTYLAKACREALDRAGLKETRIVATNDLDEYVIRELKAQGAPIDVFGVGTRLATAYGEPALNGVYKLVALRTAEGLIPKIKTSSNPAKTTIPSPKQVWRWQAGSQYRGDCLALAGAPPPRRMIHPDHEHLATNLDPDALVPLLEPKIAAGKRVAHADDLATIRARVKSELDRLPIEHQRLVHPHIYRVGLSPELWEQRRSLMHQIDGGGAS